ncbi:hypothetical protein P153DRAFT_368452 [Dothidotthia symphoricarpi CBS 119687]|uniref:Uncharacterized protein n=1 Tax=Dothidotthia symphoricarpi CBS 119687 TaxID=1392245 RepID=A0A6A6A8Y0_9PLEO|nr:uncharacterized protein P153DRAFT_368452 [Dothidotthia symphoricarpi CBS 119687]KAF2127111.1 hypothetical protein P153DRAFT_368452 [Dothidotthia symphoricarpi CBS 119687]
MTGQATNKWCGQKINVNYNGDHHGHDDIDLSLAAWNKLGMVEKTRIQGTWSKVA